MALDSLQKTRITVVALVVQAVVAALTLRDIKRRTDAQIRGPRKLWQVWGTANTAGSAAYWLVGRKRRA